VPSEPGPLRGSLYSALGCVPVKYCLARLEHMPKTILIVDDNELLRTSLSFLITSNFASVSLVEAKDAAKAIECTIAKPPDLVILDVAMPGMNGLFAAPILRTLAPKAAIMLFSLYANEVRNPYQFGVDAVVSKSQGAETFLNTVRELLASARPAELPALASSLPQTPQPESTSSDGQE